jgi:hypothetical protein
MHNKMTQVFVGIAAIGVITLVGLELGCKCSEETNEEHDDRVDKTDPPAMDDEAIPHAAKRGNAKRCALLVGIDAYGDGPATVRPWKSLAGALNDIQALETVLKGHPYNFEVAVLTDRDATFQGIKRAFQEKLIDCVRGPGDVAFFHYSGHGQQVTDDNGDEWDGFDETIVPFDNRGIRDGTNNIRDDHMNVWLAKLRAKKSEVFLSFDSCHSGSMSRGAGEEDPKEDANFRGERTRSQPAAETRGASASQERDDEKMPWMAKGAGGREGFVMLSAADSNELAWETRGCGGAHKPCMGLYTAALVKALRSMSRRMTYSQLHTAITSDIRGSRTNQQPQLQGDRDRGLFANVTPRCRRRGFVVRETDSRKNVQLEAGQVHGLTKGTVLAIYPAASALNDSKQPKAHIRVTRVYANHSDARVVGPSPDGKTASFRNARIAVVDYAHPDSPLKARVRMEKDVPGLGETLGRWHYQSVKRGEAELVVQAGAGNKVVLVDNRGKRLWSGRAGAVTSLADRIQQYFKSRTLSGLKGGDFDVDVTLKKQKARLSWVNRTTVSELDNIGPAQEANRFAPCRPGKSKCELIELSIRNREAFNVYVTVLSAAPGGLTEVRVPQSQNDKVKLRAGETKSKIYSYEDRKGAYKFHVFLTKDKVEKETLWSYVHDPKAPKCRAPRSGSRGGLGSLSALSTNAYWEMRTVNYTIR